MSHVFGMVILMAISGRPNKIQEDMIRVQLSFQRNPKKSIRTASKQLGLPRTTIPWVLHQVLHLTSCGVSKVLWSVKVVRLNLEHPVYIYMKYLKTFIHLSSRTVVLSSKAIKKDRQTTKRQE